MMHLTMAVPGEINSIKRVGGKEEVRRFLETLGFYIGALLYFIAASLIAQPMKITPKLAAKRVAVCFVCIAFLYCLFTVLLAVQIPKGIFGI